MASASGTASPKGGWRSLAEGALAEALAQAADALRLIRRVGVAAEAADAAAPGARRTKRGRASGAGAAHADHGVAFVRCAAPLAVTPSCANVQVMMATVTDAVAAGGRPAKHSKSPELAQCTVTVQSLVEYAYLFVVACCNALYKLCRKRQAPQGVGTCCFARRK